MKKIKQVFDNINADRRIRSRFLQAFILPLGMVVILIAAILSIVNVNGVSLEVASQWTFFAGIILVSIYSILSFIDFIKYYKIKMIEAKDEANKLDKADVAKKLKKQEKLERKAHKKLDKIENRNKRYTDSK